MIQFNDIELRNLEEQVLRNTQLLNMLPNGITGTNFRGIFVNLQSASKINNNELALVGSSAPYTLYYKQNNNLVNLGKFPSTGPQGIQGVEGKEGPKGEDGTEIQTGGVAPSIAAKNGTIYIDYITGNLYVYEDKWVLKSNIRGPEGLIGKRGPQGIQGVPGVQGPQGEIGPAGGSYQIIGKVSSVDELPAPVAGKAYLVGTEGNYLLYVSIGGYWESAGSFNAPNQVEVDVELSEVSTHPVMNATITMYINNLLKNFNKYIDRKNMCNPDTITLGAFINYQGVAESHKEYYITDYIEVLPGETYVWKYNEGAIGGLYNEDQDWLGQINKLSNFVQQEGDYVILTIPFGVRFIRLNGRIQKTLPQEAMLIRGTSVDDYPTQYIPYGAILTDVIIGNNIQFTEESLNKILDTISKTIPGTMVERSANLLNLDDPDVKHGYYLDRDGLEVASNNANISGYIPIDPNKSYITATNSAFYGPLNVNVQFYDASKTRIGAILGSTSGISKATITTPYPSPYETATILCTGIINRIATLQNAKYARISYWNNVSSFKGSTSSVMFLEGDDPNNYPVEFEPYFYHKSLTNDYGLNDTQIAEVEQIAGGSLKDKVIVFDGDSICHAASAGTTDNGWARRVGEANGMIWYNKGIGGGTIGNYSGYGSTSHVICESFESYPDDVDYIIIEGGTNDADKIKYTYKDPSIIGTYSLTDWSGNYDNTTFCGAMEYMFFNILKKWPNVKLGYIVAPKMGYAPSSLTYNFEEGNPRYDIFLKAMEICKKWGVKYVNLWDESTLNPMINSQYDKYATTTENTNRGSLYTDGQHLTAKGYDKITAPISQLVKSV